MQSISSYINPNTRGLTSNYKNTAIKDKETYNEAMSQHLLNPVEDLVQVLKTPIKLARSSSLSRQNNSVNIAEGQRIRVNGGHVLTVTAHGVEVSGGDNPYDTQSYVKAQRMADALASMLRNAGGTMTTVAHSKEEYAWYTEGITDVMSYLGIDTSKDFTVNGMKYSKNKDGWYESEANSDAQAAYEQLKANNRTYQFADEKTKKQIAYISDYYLQVLVSYHGISKLTIAKMADVEEQDIDRLLANPPEKVEIEVKYKIAVTVMELRFWLKDCELPI